MKAIYILLVLLIVSLVPGCVDSKEKELSNTPTGEILQDSYVSGIEGNLTQIESMLNETEESYSIDVSDSAFT